MEQKLSALPIILVLAGCSAASAFGAPAPILIPKVDPDGFLKQVDNRLAFNDWPLSLILTASWPIEKFTGEILTDAAARSTFVRDALADRENSPTLTISFHKIPPDFDAALYLRALQRQQPKYFSTIIKKQIEDDRVGVKNSIFYITSRGVDGAEQTAYIVHTTKNDVGVEVILEAGTDSLNDISQEFESILASLRSET